MTTKQSRTNLRKSLGIATPHGVYRERSVAVRLAITPLSYNKNVSRAVSAAVAHLVYTEGVIGSNPILPRFLINSFDTLGYIQI